MQFKYTTVVLAAVAVLTGAGVAGAAQAVDYGKDHPMNGTMMGRFGGPIYNGPPALAVTASLVAAGGGAENYSTATALTNMVGSSLVKAEVAKLSKQYGSEEVGQWLKTFDFAVKDALRIATAKGISLPAGNLSGKELAATLVKAGTAPDGTFEIEFLLDKAVSHPIHVQVMNDIDKEPGLGPKADLDYHLISNQAFYDLAQALGDKDVKLSPVH
jgi:MoxR-like ATPase